MRAIVRSLRQTQPLPSLVGTLYRAPASHRWPRPAACRRSTRGVRERAKSASTLARSAGQASILRVLERALRRCAATSAPTGRYPQALPVTGDLPRDHRHVTTDTGSDPPQRPPLLQPSNDRSPIHQRQHPTHHSLPPTDQHCCYDPMTPPEPVASKPDFYHLMRSGLVDEVGPVGGLGGEGGLRR